MAQLGRMFAIGTTFVSMVIAGGLLGWGVDYIAKTKPWALLVGLLVGLVAGMVRFIKDAKAAGAPPPGPRT